MQTNGIPNVAQVKDSMDLEKVTIPVLLPHEVLHALHHAGDVQVECENQTVWVKLQQSLFCLHVSQITMGSVSTTLSVQQITSWKVGSLQYREFLAALRHT